MCFLAEAADGQCHIPYKIRGSVRTATPHGHMCTAGAHTCQSLPKACISSKVPSFSECWCSSGAFAPIEDLRGCERVIRLKEPNSAFGMLYAGAPFLGAFFLLHLLFALLLPCSFLCHAQNGRSMRLSTRVAGDYPHVEARI
jgi:hypothetical protein